MNIRLLAVYKRTSSLGHLTSFYPKPGKRPLWVQTVFLLVPAPTTETCSPALKYCKSVAVYHLDFQILSFHTASASKRVFDGCKT